MSSDLTPLHPSPLLPFVRDVSSIFFFTVWRIFVRSIGLGMTSGTLSRPDSSLEVFWLAIPGQEVLSGEASDLRRSLRR